VMDGFERLGCMPVKFTVVELPKFGLLRLGELLVKLSVLLFAVTGPDPSPVSVPIVTVAKVTKVPPE
jgi:hypothetical protein